MSLAQRAIAMGALRASNNLKIRQPLSTLYLVTATAKSATFRDGP